MSQFTLNYLLEGSTGTSSSGSMVSMIIMIVGVVAIFYFLMYRPQKKQEKEKQRMYDSLAVGDVVTTIGGIVGEIVSIKDDTVLIETSRDRTRLRMLKSAISIINSEKEPAKEEKNEKSKDKPKEK